MANRHRHPRAGRNGDHFVAKEACVDLAPTVCFRPAWHWHDEGDRNERIVGYVVAHDVDGAKVRCESACMIEGGFGPAVWQQTGGLAGGDLTLSPSIQCKTHPAFHGFVQNGKWVPA